VSEFDDMIARLDKAAEKDKEPDKRIMRDCAVCLQTIWGFKDKWEHKGPANHAATPRLVMRDA